VTTAAPIRSTSLPFPLVVRGKVRDVYDVGDDRLLIVATDRLSAFDVVMTEPIPGKGEVLTQVTAWWLDRLADLTPHHLISVDVAAIEAAVPSLAPHRDAWSGRSMLVRRTVPVPIECVVRGYMAGSAWAEYCERGTLAGERLPEGLEQCCRLEEPIFSPATKAQTGHDENITYAEVERLAGAELAAELRSRSLAIYRRGRDVAEAAGIIVADTKFEFGIQQDGSLLLIDEVLTPDSSRFWPRDGYAPGRTQPSLDKQPVRDYLEGLARAGKWNKASPPPTLPDEVITSTAARYRELYRRLTGRDLAPARAGTA
jgi:phosphoribosylaminoimidazole-succinocarboxamide synthase